MSVLSVAEVRRLAAVARILVLAEANRAELDGLAELAAVVMDAPVALVNLVGGEHLHLVGLVGLGEPWQASRRAPLETGISAAVTRAGNPVYIGNARGPAPGHDQPLNLDGLDLLALAGVPLRDRDGYVLGALVVADSRPRRWGTTERRSLEVVGAAVMTELALQRDVDRRQRLLDALDAAPAAIAVTRGADQVLDYSNAAFCATFASGSRPGGIPAQLSDLIARAWVSGEAVHAQAVRLRVGAPPVGIAGGSEPEERFFDVACSLIGRVPSQGSALENDPRGVLTFAVEVTDAVQARRELERYARHQSFLARAAAVLGSNLDPAVELSQLAQVVVPDLADLATVHLLARPVPPFRRPPLPVVTDRVAVAAVASLAELPEASTGLVWNGDGDPITEAIRHGRLLRQPYDTPVPPSWSVATGSAGSIRAGLRHIVLAPVVVDGLVVAVVSFGMCEGRSAWRDDELSVLAEVVRLAGTGLGHGMSYQQVRDSALVLQRSLLGEIPQVEGLEFCARYRPAGQDEVGGDWYDVFSLDPMAEAVEGGAVAGGAVAGGAVAGAEAVAGGAGVGGLALVVGDVVGHDMGAAAAMGQLRASLRTLALDHPASPADIVNRLARVNSQLGITEFATLLHAQLKPVGDGCWSMSWAVAGHLPPLMLTHQGARLLEQATGCPLMIATTEGRANAHIVLEPGATVLLYTDGLVERRGVDLADCLMTMTGHAAGFFDRPIEDLCDELIRHAPTDDDAAVLVARIVPVPGRSEASPHQAESGAGSPARESGAFA